MTPDTAQTAKRPTARLISPSFELASCIRAYVVRDTVGAVLTDAQRLNYFPAAPTCVITWLLEGSIDWVQTLGEEAQVPVPQGVLFRGPRQQAYMAYSPRPMKAFMCILMPDAMHALTGQEPAEWVDKLVSVDCALDAHWQSMARSVQQAKDDETRVALIESFIKPRWQAARQKGHVASTRYHDWAQGLAVRAAASGIGRSARQIERRIKAWAGLPLHVLRRFGRAELVMFGVQKNAPLGDVAWPELADETGYSDQAHLCRAIRQASGFSPQMLRHLMETNEAFWLYRIWR